MLTALDVMTSGPFTISQDATVEDAIRALLEYEISGAPVIDEHGNMVGIVSEFQLLEVIYDSTVRSDRVGDLMTTDVITVTTSTPMIDIANLFVVHRIRRVPVVSDGQLVGIISRRDLLAAAPLQSSTNGNDRQRLPIGLQPAHHEV